MINYKEEALKLCEQAIKTSKFEKPKDVSEGIWKRNKKHYIDSHVAIITDRFLKISKPLFEQLHQDREVDDILSTEADIKYSVRDRLSELKNSLSS